ncbi:hypothetical protein FOMPIDRAFT_1056415 [Fomitopsis schrenkii]|uniref:Uncharacterized protein n=1 Tax=Fomitopsis schrenkii TaxID=2126942 RepID=S8ET99_FOMSC|nr:hypothetical protein FOMPIDRAFT_1056415 [Fomitopsis schrenkii]
MSPTNSTTTCRLRSNSKAELVQQAPASEGLVKDRSANKKRKHQDSDSKPAEDKQEDFNDADAKALKKLEKKHKNALKKKEA